MRSDFFHHHSQRKPSNAILFISAHMIIVTSARDLSHATGFAARLTLPTLADTQAGKYLPRHRLFMVNSRAVVQAGGADTLQFYPHIR
jgi:hypothetical protein